MPENFDPNATPVSDALFPASAVPAVDMKMQATDFAALRDQAAQIGLSDMSLGKMLNALILHIGHLHGFDPTEEDAKLLASARVIQRAEEDAQIAASADLLAATRLAEDAQPHTPEQTAALTQLRAAEDAKITADADALAKGRAAEDALTAETAGAAVAPVAPVVTPMQSDVPGGQKGI